MKHNFMRVLADRASIVGGFTIVNPGLPSHIRITGAAIAISGALLAGYAGVPGEALPKVKEDTPPVKETECQPTLMIPSPALMSNMRRRRP